MPGNPTLEQAARRVLKELPAAMGALADVGRAHTPARSDKIGRNEPCPCGSGRKYKHCRGAA